MVETSRLKSDQDTVESVPQFSPFKLFHYFEQDFVAVFVSEDVDNLVAGQAFEGLVDVFVDPVVGDALEDHIAGELADCVVGEFGQDAGGDAHAFVLVEELMAELYDVVAVAIHDESVDVEGDLGDQLSSDVFQLVEVGALLALELAETANHVFDDAHSILVEGKRK